MQSLKQFPFPNDFVHAVLAAHCAHRTSKLSSDSLPKPGDQAQFASDSSLFKFYQQVKNADLNRLIEDWKIQKVFHDPETQYIGILYVKEAAKQAVLVHRGTDFKRSLLKGLFKKSGVQADIEGIFMGRILEHQFRGYQATYEALQFIKENPNYYLSFAGHSLGSWLAQLSLLYCHTDFKFTSTKAITFDGPGSYEMMKQLRKSEVKGAGLTFKPHELDIVSYLCAPNFVNCSNKHIGNCYRLFPDIKSPKFLENKFVKFMKQVTGSKMDALMSVMAHDMKYILPFFEEATGRPVCEKVIQWPSITHNGFGHSEETLFKKHLSEVTKKHDGGFIRNILTKIGISLADSVLSKLFSAESTTLGSLIYLFKDFFSGQISMDQFWVAHDYLDRSNQYKPKTSDLKTNFNLTYKGGYQVEADDPYSRQIRDNIDEMLMKLSLKEHHAFITDQTFFTLLSWIRDKYVYSHSQNSLEIKEQFRSQITMSQLRDLTRAFDKHSFDEYMRQGKSLNRVFPRKVINAGNNPLVRQIEMDKVRDKLSKNNAVAISGEPGFGKSTLAHYYALELEKSNIVPIEFNAAEGKLFDEYRNYAESLNVDTKDKNNEVIFQLVNHELRQSGKQILLIYDNVDKMEDILLYMNNLPANAKLIITTRDFKLLEKDNIRIGAFTETDAQQYLKQSLPLIRDNEIKETIRLIGCIPQNLAIMISYLKSNQSETIKEYLNNLPKRGETIYTKYFKTMCEKEPEAWKLMQSLAYLDPDFVPLKLIQRITDPKLADSLSNYSLIGWIEKEGYRGVRIHREVQRQVKMYSTNNNQNFAIEGIFIQLLTMFEDVFPWIGVNPNKEWKKASLLSGNVKSFFQEINSRNLERQDMIKLAKLYSCMGQFEEQKNCNFEKAKEYHEQALMMRQRLFPNDHPDVANSLDNVGDCYGSLGDHQKALEYHEQALMMRQRLFPNDHPDVANSLDNVGDCYGSLGDHQKALEYQEKALMMRQRLFLNDHPDVANSLNNVGDCYGSLGKIQKALEYQEKALLMTQRLFPGDHPDVANSLNNVGDCYESLGDHQKALEYQEKALIMRQRLFSGDHPDVASSLNNVGVCYGSLGDHQKALEYQEKALLINQRLFTEDHPDVAACLNNVGDCYGTIGDNKKALEYKEKAILMHQRLFSGDHPNDAAILNNIGYSYKSLGDYKKALDYHIKALSMTQRLFHDDHPHVAVSLNNVGECYGLLGENQKAHEYQEKALLMNQRLFPGDHPDVASSLNYIGLSYGSLGDHQKALEYQEKALTMRQRLFSGDHPDVAISLNNVGLAYGTFGDYQKALEYQEKAFLISQKLFPEDHPNVATFLNNIGLTYGSFGDHQKSLEYKEKALLMNQRLFSDDHPNIATSLNNVGDCYRSLGENKKALEYQEKALLMNQRLFPGDHPNIATFLNNIGLSFGSLGDNKIAKEYHEKALMMRQRLFPGDHPDVASSLNNIGLSLGSLGEIKKALEYQEKALLMNQRLFPGDHPNIATFLNNIGLSYGSLGDNKKALEYQEKALLMNQRLFPGDHPDIATFLNNIGLSYGSLGDNEKALEYQQKALLMNQRLFLGDHPNNATFLNNIALSYGSLGDNKKSLYYLFQAYSMKKQLDLPIDDLLQTIIFLLFKCKIISPFDILQAKLNLLVPASVSSKDLFSLKLLLKPNSFILVQEKSAEGEWKSVNTFCFKFTKRVDHFVSTERLKKRLGSDCSQSNIEEARMLYFEAICLGIVFSDKQNLECAFEFAKKFPGLLIRIAKEHPDYFIDKMIATQLKSHALLSEQAYSLVSGSFK